MIKAYELMVPPEHPLITTFFPVVLTVASMCATISGYSAASGLSS
jgi:hypothetical protein